MAKSYDVTHPILSTRTSLELQTAFEQRCKELQITPSDALAAAVDIFVAFSSADVRAGALPFVRSMLAGPAGTVLKRSARAWTMLQLSTLCPGEQCPVPALRTATPAPPKPCACPAPAPAARSAKPTTPDALAGLEDFERRDAAKITDPAKRAAFVASRLARRAK